MSNPVDLASLDSSLASLGDYLETLNIEMEGNLGLVENNKEKVLKKDVKNETVVENVDVKNFVSKVCTFDEEKLNVILNGLDDMELGFLVIAFEWIKTVLRKILINANKFKDVNVEEEDVKWRLALSYSEEIIDDIGFEKDVESGTLRYCADTSRSGLKVVEGLLNEGIDRVNLRLKSFEKKNLFGNFSLSRSFLDFSESCRFIVGFSDSIGRRPSMEDELVISGMGPRKRVNEDFYGVFDGHGGNEASTFVATHISDYMRKNLFYTNNDIERALHLSFEQMDKAMCDKNMRAGTCAVCLFAAEDRYYIANTGDSRSVLGCKNIVSKRLTTDHNLESQSEIDRIAEAGGVIKNVRGVPRINGKIAVSRSLGDSEHADLVVYNPDITIYEYTEESLFVILACDGIWDVLSDQEAVEIVFAQKDPEDAASALVKESYERNSDDNMSVIVIFLKERQLWDDQIAQDIKNGTIQIAVKDTYTELQQKQLSNPIKTKTNPIGSKRNRYPKKGRGAAKGKKTEHIVFEQSEIPDKSKKSVEVGSPSFDDLEETSSLSSSSSEEKRKNVVYNSPESSSLSEPTTEDDSSEEIRPKSF